MSSQTVKVTAYIFNAHQSICACDSMVLPFTEEREFARTMEAQALARGGVFQRFVQLDFFNAHQSSYLYLITQKQGDAK